MNSRLPALLGIFGGAMALVTLTAMALATVPPQGMGQWAKLTICTLTKSKDDHEALLARLSATGEIWVRKTAIIGVQDKPGWTGCSTIVGASGKSFLVKATADELAKVLQ